jgi:uncharacterized membrane protein YfcA
VPLEPLQLAIALLACTVGAAVQAAAGFGLALIAAPILVLLEPAFVPGPLTAASLALTVLVAARDHAAMDLHGIGWALVGRVFGTAAAAVFLSLATPRVFDLAFGLLVFLGVGLSLAGFHVAPARGSAIVAGGLSGLMGTISAIGGPPMALLYQRAGAERLRGTLAGFFVLGTGLSLGALAYVGRFGPAEWQLSLWLTAPMVVGFIAAAPLRSRMDANRVRPLVLGLSFVSAVAVLWRALT